MPIKGKKRNGIEIVGDILRNVADSGEKGLTKTAIMYGANMSYDQLKKFLDFLLRRGLIIGKEPEREIHYILSCKGKEVLTILGGLFALLGGGTLPSPQEEKEELVAGVAR